MNCQIDVTKLKCLLVSLELLYQQTIMTWTETGNFMSIQVITEYFQIIHFLKTF